MCTKDVYLSVDQQISRLRERKLNISNEDHAKSILSTINYSCFIKYYGNQFLEKPQKDYSNYKPGADFEEIYSLYVFNQKIRALFLEYLLIAERKLKTIIADHFANVYGPTSYWNKSSFSARSNIERKSMESSRLEDLHIRLKEDIAREFTKDIENTPFEKYKDDHDQVPIWLLVNIMSIGTIRNFYNCLKEEDQKIISMQLSMTDDMLETAWYFLNTFRNACAHDERIDNYYSKRTFDIIKDNDEVAVYYGVYAVVIILKMILPSRDFIEFYDRLDEYFRDLELSINTSTISDIKHNMKFPEDKNITLADLGQNNIGIALSRTEFVAVLERYIIPLIPQGKIEKNITEIPKKKISSYVMFDEKESRIFFSQSSNTEYLICTQKLSLHQKSIMSLITIIEDHLSELISNIQIVWNTKKTASLRKRELDMLFAFDIEIAYQISICTLLCYRKTPELINELNKRKAEAGDKEKRVNSSEEKRSIRAEISKFSLSIQPIIDIERKQRETLYGVLARFDQWALKTYEGKHISLGVIITCEVSPYEAKSFDYIDFLAQNYSATISDGMFSCVELYADGIYSKHIPSTLSQSDLHKIPYPYQGFAQACNSGKIGVILMTEGDIIIISDQHLAYSKHSGRWTYNMYELAEEVIRDQLHDIISPNTEAEVANVILQTLVDVSYSHGGACIAIANENPLPSELLRMAFPTLLDMNDRKRVEDDTIIGATLTEDERKKDPFRHDVLCTLVGSERLFYRLNSYLRRELVEMDGALILGPDAKIYAVASIVNTNGASVLSGARTTAAIRLSQYGLAIKVSQDGYMTFYKGGEAVLSI